MKKKHLVIGANGHLGNNLVIELAGADKLVKATVRSKDRAGALNGLNCEIAYANLLDKNSLFKAALDAHTIYLCAAVYKSWAKDPSEEIIKVNVEGTKNVIWAAKKAGVEKIIFVSSTFTLDHSHTPMDETGWNTEISNPYIYSKIVSEKIALKTASELNIDLVSIVPSGMIGPNAEGNLTPTMAILDKMINNGLPFDPCFNFNLVDVRDVAKAMIAAADNGRSGERYIIGNRRPISTTEIFRLAHTLYPEIKTPGQASKKRLLFMAGISEIISKIKGVPPLMLRSHVRHMYKADFSYNPQKARKELKFSPAPLEETLKECIKYLKLKKSRMHKL